MLLLMPSRGMRVGVVLKLRPADILDRKLILNDIKSGKKQESIFIPQKVSDDPFKVFSRLAIGPFRSRQFSQGHHRRSPFIGEPASGIFDQRIHQHGFYMRSVTLVGAVHTPTSGGLPQHDKISRAIAAPVKPRPVHKRLH
jgi:hypothetical protein